MSRDTQTQKRRTAKQRRGWPTLDVALGLVPLLAVSFATCWMLALPTSQVALVVAPYLGLGALLLAMLPASQAGPGLGPANRLTLARAT